MKKEQPSPLKPDNSIDMQAEEELSSSDNMLEAAEGVETEKKLWQEDMESCLILEDEDNIYVCGTYKLLKIDKESKKEQVLWESGSIIYREAPYLYFEGKGLLLNSRIYFIEAWTEDEGETENRALAVIGTDGSGYQRIEQISGNNSMLVMAECCTLMI